MADQVDLSTRAPEFLRWSIRRDRRLRRRSTVVLSALLALALAEAGVTMIQQNAAQQSLREAVARQLVAQPDAAPAADPCTVLLHGIAAQPIRADPGTRSSLVETLTHTPDARSLPHADEGPPRPSPATGATSPPRGWTTASICGAITRPDPPAPGRPDGGLLDDRAQRLPTQRLHGVVEQAGPRRARGRRNPVLVDVERPQARERRAVVRPAPPAGGVHPEQCLRALGPRLLMTSSCNSAARPLATVRRAPGPSVP
jgi:hypothetical protein